MSEESTMICHAGLFGAVRAPLISGRAVVLFAALWLAAACLANPALAEDSGCTDAAATNPAGDEVRAYVDPETGELVSGPPPGQREAPDAPAAAPSQPDYPATVRPDGTVELDLSQRPQEQLRAEVVDGKPVLCHGDASPAAPSD